MQLDALMGNDISVISHFTFSQSAPEPNPFLFQSFVEGNAIKPLIITLLTASLAALCNAIIAGSLLIRF